MIKVTYNELNQCHSFSDKPAIANWQGDKFWYKNGECHRDSGPAILFVNGQREYWLNGNQISEENFYLNKKLQSELNVNKNNITNKVKI